MRTVTVTALLAIVWLAGSCSFSLGGGGAYVATKQRGIVASGQPALNYQSAMVDPAVSSAINGMMTGRTLSFGFLRDFSTGTRRFDLENGQEVYTLPSPGEQARAILTLTGNTADFTFALSTAQPGLTELSLHGTFDSSELTPPVKRLMKLPFDAAVSATAGLTPITLHWTLSGKLNGTAFSESFTQLYDLSKHDAVNNI